MTKRKKLFLVLTIAWLCVIFGHSLMPASVSGKESSGVLKWIQQFLPWLSHTLLRKLAHFGAFAVLGGLLFGLFRQCNSFHLLKPLGTAFSCAFTDETIQLFSPGRSSQVTDVWIDLAGAASAIALLLILARKRGCK